MTPFTSFAPDLDPTTPGVITDATNLIPTLRGYVGGPSGAEVGMAALSAAAISAAVVTKLDGSTRTFAGTTDKLWEKSGSSWTDVSRATPAYGASTVNPWRFAQLGNTTLAVSKADQLQSTSSGAFANLNAPKAAVMCTWKGFVVLGNTDDGGAGTAFGDSPDRWWTSAYLDETDWTPDVSTQCTTGRLVETPGAITGLKVLGEYIIAYKEDSMYVGRDAGTPEVLRFTRVPGDIGCASHEAVADTGTAHIFVGPNDIYLFDGNIPQSIGAPLREWFFADLDPQYSYRIRSSHDKTNALVYFHYPRVGSSGTLDGCIVYNYKTNKWGVTHKTIECLVEYVSGGYTYETLPIEGMTYADWPLISYDDPLWTASTRSMAYFGSDHKIYSTTGTSTSASITSGAYGEENFYTLIQRVTARYLNKPTTASATHYYTEDLGGTWTEGETVTESSGRFDFLHSAPWHKVRFDYTGDFEIVGASAETQQDGVL